MKNILLVLLSMSILLSSCNFFMNNGITSAFQDYRVQYENESVKILENNQMNVFIFDKNTDFEVSENKRGNSTFYMNTNFFDPNENPIGLVVINKKRKSSRVDRGGYFYVKNGKSHVSPSCPKNVTFASQSILIGIKNGRVNKRLTRMNHAKERTYRNIVGQNNNGDIVIIASKFNGLVTIGEIIEEANKFNLKNAILYDGGSSVDYYFDNGEFSVGFDSSPKIISKLLSLGEPTTYLTID